MTVVRHQVEGLLKGLNNLFLLVDDLMLLIRNFSQLQLQVSINDSF